MMDVICGLIGAGKSTYAARNYETIYECEDGCKEIQIEKARNNGNKKAAYVTCYPTRAEMDFFRTLKDVHFIWINTTEERAEKNIRIRGRKRDIEDIKGTLRKNHRLSMRVEHSRIPFEFVDVFRTDERW